MPQAQRELKLEAQHKQDLLIDQKIKQDLVNAEMNLQKGMYQRAKTKTPYGVAAQYSKELVKCQFKLIVYWKVKKDGTPYTQFEIDNYENLKKIPSLDFDAYNRINHQVAYDKLCDKVYNEANRMNKAILVYMDYANSEEHWIASFNTTNLIHSIVKPVHFKPKDENGHIRFDYYEGDPIRLNQMRSYEK